MSYKPPTKWYICKYCLRAYQVRNDLIRHKHEHIQFREQRLEKSIRDSENQEASCLNTSTNNTIEKSIEKGRIESSNHKNNTEPSPKVSSSSERNSEKDKRMRVLAQPPTQVQVQVQPEPVKSGDRLDRDSFPRNESTMDKEKEQVQTIIQPVVEGTEETVLRDLRGDSETEDGGEQSETVEDVSVSKSSMKNCDRCSKSFSSEYYLKYHELLDHSGDHSRSSSSSLQSPTNSTNNNTNSDQDQNNNQEQQQLVEPDSTNFSSLKRNNPRPNQRDKKKSKKSKTNRINKSKSKQATFCCCQICQKMFKNSGHLKSHMKSHDRTGKSFYCSFCQKNLDLKDEAFFFRHRDICSKVTEFPCSVSTCTLTFHFKADLQTHELIDHFNTDFHCSICSRLFTRKSALDSHMRIQHCLSEQAVES